MGELEEWLNENLKTPEGQLVLLLLTAVVRLAYGYLADHREKKRVRHKHSSPKA